MRHLVFPFSYYRPRIETPEVLPQIDNEKLVELNGFLNKHKLIVVDDIAASYRYGPQKYAASADSLLNYVGYKDLRKHFVQEVVGKPSGLVSDLLIDLEDRTRQVSRRAENLEINLGMFYGLALMRQRALTTAVKSLNNGNGLPDEMYTRHCADAIVDMGQAMMAPKTIPSPDKNNRKYDVEHARSIQEFGLYAYEIDREALGTKDGIFVMHFVNQEQDRRVRTFGPRYRTLLLEFGTQMPNQVISTEMSDEQMLSIEFVALGEVE